LRERALAIAGELLERGGKAGKGGGGAVARSVLESGSAWRKFVSICEAQGGMREPPLAAHTAEVVAERVGRIVEIGMLDEVFNSPQHPYTRALLSAVPVPDPKHRRTEPLPRGEIPNPVNPPMGCHFHPRCPIAREGVCNVEVPELRPVEGGTDHSAACHLRTGDYTAYDPDRLRA
jgi:oligopeptide/dipeptide ABC transporter ATP-binding protein